MRFDSCSGRNTLDPDFSGLGGAGTCTDNEKVQISQIYLCNANKMKEPSLTMCFSNVT